MTWELWRAVALGVLVVALALGAVVLVQESTRDDEHPDRALMRMGMALAALSVGLSACAWWRGWW